MQTPRCLDLGDFVLDTCDANADQPPNHNKLRFAGAAKKTNSAALPFKVSPKANQPAALLVEMGEFYLKGAFFGFGAAS